ncbi:MAG: hypothetical protein U0821_11965 [Chloroflexota bacterium]
MTRTISSARSLKTIVRAARVLGSSLALSLSLGLLLPLVGTAHTCTPNAEVGVSGALLLPRGSGLARIELPSKETRQLPVLPSQGVVMGVAQSADASRLAVARFWRPPDQPVGGQDVLIVGPDGGAPERIIARSRPGEIVGSPTWLADGSLVVEIQNAAGTSLRLERVATDNTRSLIADHATFPAVAPNNQQIAFVRPGETPTLIIRDLAGGPERVLVDEPAFVSLTFPRFSPDGAWIAFAAASDPTLVLAPARWSPLSSLVSTAHAHGVPWDIWLVRPDGSERKRLTYFFDDDPAAAWSPDGHWMVVFAAEALHVVSVDGPDNYCIEGTGGFGSLEWLSRG